jgi:Carboxypeptidase regulatory-like domain
MPIRRAIELCEFLSLIPIQRHSLARAIAVFVLVVLSFASPSRVFSQGAASGGPASASSQNPAQTFTLTGTVLDAVTGEPIRKALVNLNSMQRRSVFSDGSGRFQFDGVPGGMVSLSAQKPGYFNQQDMMRGAVPSVEVGANAPPAAVKLTPESVVTGKVTDANGVPLEHVSLSLNYIDIHDGRRRWESKGSANTDEDGLFRFAGLHPGSYYVSAAPFTPVADTTLDAEQPPKSGYAGVYYPGVPDLASASAIQLAAGQQAEANLSLNPVPMYTVSGTVSGYEPNQGVGLQVFDQSGVQVPTGVDFSAENGRFDVHSLPPGSYVLKAYSSTGPNQPVRAELRFSLAADLHNLRLVLAPAPTIQVVVNQVANGQSNQAKRARFVPNSAGPPVTVRLIGSAPGTGEAYAEFDPASGNQNLILRNIEPGRYTAVIDARESWYVASAEYGQTNLLTDDLVVTAGAAAQTLTIELRNDSATLTGTVTVPDGVTTPVTVVAVPDKFAKSTLRAYYYPPRGKSEPNGGFVLDSIAPGDYTVFAFDQADGIEYANPDVLQKYVSQSTHVTLSPNQRAKVTLELIRTAEGTN